MNDIYICENTPLGWCHSCRRRSSGGSSSSRLGFDGVKRVSIKISNEGIDGKVPYQDDYSNNNHEYYDERFVHTIYTYRMSDVGCWMLDVGSMSMFDVQYRCVLCLWFFMNARWRVLVYMSYVDDDPTLYFKY